MPNYKKSQGYLLLVAWRNFNFHDPSHDLKPIEASSRYKNIGEICTIYLGKGKCIPDSENDFEMLYKGILCDILESIENLRVALEQYGVNK